MCVLRDMMNLITLPLFKNTDMNDDKSRKQEVKGFIKKERLFAHIKRHKEHDVIYYEKKTKAKPRDLFREEGALKQRLRNNKKEALIALCISLIQRDVIN